MGAKKKEERINDNVSLEVAPQYVVYVYVFVCIDKAIIVAVLFLLEVCAHVRCSFGVRLCS